MVKVFLRGRMKREKCNISDNNDDKKQQKLDQKLKLVRLRSIKIN